MAHNSVVQVRVDEQFKKEADALFASLGLDTSTAIRIFLKQALLANGLPFQVSLTPNAITRSAMLEAEELINSPSAKRYSSFAEVLADIEKE